MHQLKSRTSLLSLIFLLMNLGVIVVDATTCGGTLIDTGSGKIKSPYYPNLYPNNVKCEWTIVSTFGQGIRIDIEDLDNKELSASGSTGRCYDTLDIYQVSASGNRHRVGESLCANTIADLPSTVLRVNASPSGNTTVVIVFSSDYVIQLKGFSLRYTMLCNETLTGTEGTLTSPNYPLDYPDNTLCKIIIKTSPGARIHFSIDDFQLVESYECSEDYISIRSSMESSGSFLGPRERYCNDMPTTFTSPSNELVVLFKSDSSRRSRGISATWSTSVPEEVPTEDATTTHAGVPGEATTKSVETTADSSSSATKPNVLSSFTKELKQLPVDGRSPEPAVGSNGIYIIVGVLIFVILAATVIILLVMRKQHHKRSTRLPQDNDVVFQNLTTADERDDDDETRTRENTYVEIPCIPYDEVQFRSNGCNGSVPPERNTSTGSDDSVAASKMAHSHQTGVEGTTSQQPLHDISERESKKEAQPYLMADDSEPVFQDENQVPAEAKPYNPYQFIEDDDDDIEQNPVPEPETVVPAEEGWYVSPRSPHSSISHGTSLYDRPRPQQSSISSRPKTPSGRRGQRNQSVESNYCPMNNSFIKKSQSPNHLSRNASTVSNSVPESIVESAVYVPMGPQ